MKKMRITTLVSFIPLVIVLAVASLAGVRVTGAGFGFVPRPLAVAILAIFAVFAVVEGLSLAWNLARGEPRDRKNIFDRIGDFITYLPWP
jgi:hypothetical protein